MSGSRRRASSALRDARWTVGLTPPRYEVNVTMPLGQIPQAQLVTQPPWHHESDDIAWILRTIEQHRCCAR